MMTEAEARGLSDRLKAAEFHPAKMPHHLVAKDYADTGHTLWTDLRCPMSRGWLLSEVREKVGDPMLHVVCSGPGDWYVCRVGGTGRSQPITDYPGETEGEALVLALEES